jgi:hypothetical protein
MIFEEAYVKNRHNIYNGQKCDRCGGTYFSFDRCCATPIFKNEVFTPEEKNRQENKRIKALILSEVPVDKVEIVTLSNQNKEMKECLLKCVAQLEITYDQISAANNFKKLTKRQLDIDSILVEIKEIMEG